MNIIKVTISVKFIVTFPLDLCYYKVYNYGNNIVYYTSYYKCKLYGNICESYYKSKFYSNLYIQEVTINVNFIVTVWLN